MEETWGSGQVLSVDEVLTEACEGIPIKLLQKLRFE